MQLSSAKVNHWRKPFHTNALLFCCILTRFVRRGFYPAHLWLCVSCNLCTISTTTLRKHVCFGGQTLRLNSVLLKCLCVCVCVCPSPCTGMGLRKYSTFHGILSVATVLSKYTYSGMRHEWVDELTFNAYEYVYAFICCMLPLCEIVHTSHQRVLAQWKHNDWKRWCKYVQKCYVLSMLCN